MSIIQRHPAVYHSSFSSLSVGDNSSHRLHPLEVRALDTAFKSANGLAYVAMDAKPASLSAIEPMAFATLQKIGSDKLMLVSLGPDKFTGQSDYLVLNKPLCRQLINTYFSDFKSNFPSICTVEDILSTIQANPASIMSQDRLLGILLGYGRQNALDYERLIKLKSLLSNPQSTLAEPLKQSLMYEYTRLDQSLARIKYGENSPFENALTVGFRANRMYPETQQLQEHYQKAFYFLNGILRQPNSVFDLISITESLQPAHQPEP